MKREETVAKLREILTRQPSLKANVGAITEDMRIGEVGFDSLSILDFMYDVENELQIQTEIAELVKIERVRDLIDYVQAKVSG
jgi:acyl carrier protein